jgi:hypothetical protein
MAAILSKLDFEHILTPISLDVAQHWSPATPVSFIVLQHTIEFYYFFSFLYDLSASHNT